MGNKDTYDDIFKYVQFFSIINELSKLSGLKMERSTKSPKIDCITMVLTFSKM